MAKQQKQDLDLTISLLQNHQQKWIYPALNVKVLDALFANGQIATQYADPAGNVSMDEEYNITPSSHLKDAPKVTKMHYDREKDIITAEVNYKGETYYLTFTRPTGDNETLLNDFWDMLIEAGEIGGSADKGTEIDTDVEEGGATESSRAKGFFPAP